MYYFRSIDNFHKYVRIRLQLRKLRSIMYLLTLISRLIYVIWLLGVFKRFCHQEHYLLDSLSIDNLRYRDKKFDFFKSVE